MCVCVGVGWNVDFWPQIRSNWVDKSARLRPNFKFLDTRLATSPELPPVSVLIPPPTLPIFPLCFFPLHDFISLLYFFIHETEKSLSLIICLISSFPRSFFTSSKSIYPEAGPCTSFHILLENSCRAVAEVYPIVFTTKEVLKRLVLLLYQTPWPYVDCVSIVFVVLSIGNPLASSLFSRIAKKVTKPKTPLQNLTRVSSGKGLTSA